MDKNKSKYTIPSFILKLHAILEDIVFYFIDVRAINI